MLEFKIESLRARGELTAEERDRIMGLLRGAPPPARPRRKWLTPLRLFLLGMIFGIGVAYVTWGWLI